MIWLYFLFKLLAYGPGLVVSQQTTGDGCFTKYDNTKVQCMNPVQSRSGTTEQQCKDLCYQAMPQCQGVQYQATNMQCDMYNSPRILRRKKRGGNYAGKNNYGNGQSQGVYVQPTPQPYKPTNPTYPSGNGQGTYQKGAGSCGGYGGSMTHTEGSTYYKPTGQSGCCSSCSLVGGDSTAVPIPTDPVPSTTVSPVLPPQATCSTGQVVRYMEVKGYQLSGNPDKQFNVDSEQSCVQACTDNKTPDGSVVGCQSADFNGVTKQCSFLLNASPPTGNGQLSKSENINHYEKVCLDSATGQVCPGPIVRAPQKILVGYAETVLTSSNFADCMQNCVNAQNRFGFKCLSGEFYSSESKDNCILSSESATTQPTLFTDEQEDKLDYFEPGCISTVRTKREIDSLQPRRRRNVLWLHKDNWGSWTRCDGDQKTRRRFRRCASFNPNKCESYNFGCDPLKRAAEWDAINDEEILSPEATSATKSSHFVDPNLHSTIAPITILAFDHNVNGRPTLPERLHHHGDEPSTGDQRQMTTDHAPTSDCEPVIKSDGSRNCKRGFRVLGNGRKQPCKLRALDNGNC